MDVGGGEGVFLCAAAKRAPALRLMLFDLPPVAEKAAARFAASGLSDRATAVGGSFLEDTLPEGADLISLVRVVHDHDDAAVMKLFRAVHAALPRNGTLLLGEPMAGTPGAERMGDAYFGFYLLAMGSGRPRTAATLTAMLRECGFGRVRQAPTHTPLLTSVLIAQPA
jgi:demethylspheroidene O-methyltransferase